MNLAEWAIRKSVLTWVFTVALAVGGWIVFTGMPRLEDPEFTVKDAVVVTPYPGASAAEVEEEVTNLIEKAAQELGQLMRVESRSSRGLSFVTVKMKEQYDKRSLPQVWDELRRKIGDYQRQLPPGAGPSLVNDDYGDVYGVYVAITGEGYSPAEMRQFAKFLQRELLQVQDVKRIALVGDRREAIYVEMRREAMAELGISPDMVYDALAAKNLAVPSGRAVVGGERITLNPTGEFVSEQEFGDLLIRGGAGASQVQLRDVADIVRGYEEPPQLLLRYDGKPAVGLAVSTVLGGNVVTMGQALADKFQELETQIPLGMELNVISAQFQAVTVAINGFLINLAEAVAIVVAVLLLFMGLRSGLIIGAVLLVTILGSFIVMGMQSVILERISLGALVIALGMLVDNAIVVTDGMRMKMEQGVDSLQAARDVVGQTSMPLLGATVVAITAFAAIGVSQDSTGEYCRSLFTVVLISLLMSWLTAVTITPLFCHLFLKKGVAGGGQADPYGGLIYRGYRGFLELSIKGRWVTVAATLGLFAAALLGFGSISKSFFPASTRPQFMVDFWFPEGTRIEETERRLAEAEEWALAQEGVEHVATSVGGGHTRFLLTYVAEKPYEAYAQMLVDVKDYRIIDRLSAALEAGLGEVFPDALIASNKFILGPGEPGKVRARVSGPDPAVLRELAGRAEAILLADPDSKAVRNDWRSPVKVLRPVMADAQARSLGIERPQLARALDEAVDGRTVGVYRERDDLLPIIARARDADRVDLDSLASVPVWSPVAGRSVPAGQVATALDLTFEDPYIWRRHRRRTMTVFSDPTRGLASEMLERVKVPIERAMNLDLPAILGKPGADPEALWSSHDASTIPIRNDAMLPIAGMPGYFFSWGGEAEDSARAQASMSTKFPPIVALMVFIVIALFNNIRKTLIIWLCVPLALIGVAAGLLVTSQPFGFMALLGLLSLSGMLIKNAIVLIDQIGMDIQDGKAPYQAIVDSGVSRLIPVSMAALTTILGMIPLVADAFFVAMAVTIMFGLGFATVLTLIVVPVLYAIFFRVPSPKRA